MFNITTIREHNYFVKIVQISAVFGVGSVGKIVSDIHRYLETRGVESWVLYGVGKTLDESRRVKRIANKVGRGIAHAYYLATGTNFALCWSSTRKIMRMIRKINPDVVHIHCCNDFYVNIHHLLRRLDRRKAKVMITQHCEQYYTGSCGYSLGCEKWKTTGCDSHCHFFQTHRKGYPLFDRSKKMWKRMEKTFRSVDANNIHFVSCTPWLDERMQESLILRQISNHSVIYNGANTDVYHFCDGARSQKKIVLYVTPRFDDEIKGSRFINDVAREFADKEQVEFHLVGNVPPDFATLPNVKIIGPLYGKDLAREYSAATVTIMLSKAECFPMVCVESILCGTKVVAFECGGPDQAYDPCFATFVPWGDFKGLAGAISDVLDCSYDKKELSALARESYSSATMADAYLRLYSSLAQSKVATIF